jgi:hypothetical protein
MAIYDGFKDFGGKRLLSRMTIYDRIRKDDISVTEYLRYAPKDIPGKNFNKNSMGTN